MAGIGNMNMTPEHYQGPLPRRNSYGRNNGESMYYNHPPYQGRGHGPPVHGQPDYSPQGPRYQGSNEQYADKFNHSFQQELPNLSQNKWQKYINGFHGQYRKSLSCGPCNRTFYSQQRLDEHLKEHVECPFPECKLSAHIKIIDQHINNQHMLVNFAALQIDDETWIAERKKRFPTAQRAELRRVQQIEKIKRGEKLGIKKKSFDKKKDSKHPKRERNGFSKKQLYEDDRKSTINNKKKNTSEVNPSTLTPEEDFSLGKTSSLSSEEKPSTLETLRPRKWPRRERPSEPPRPSLDVDLYSSDEEILGVTHFKGTRKFYESTGEVNYFSSIHARQDSAECDIAISDDEEWDEEKKPEKETTGSPLLGGALGSLMGAYLDSEDENDQATPMSTDKVRSTVISSAPTKETPEGIASNKVRKVTDLSKNSYVPKTRTNRRQRSHQRKKPPQITANNQRGPKRRRTLLERLLQADIIHERNLILQCVHYVVENDFFDKTVHAEGKKEVKTYTLEEKCVE